MSEEVIEKKNEKAEDFIGWKSPDGLLEVIGQVSKGKHAKFKVVCKICSNDTELFPVGYFIRTKYELKSGKKPCGCSKSPRWTKEQLLINARRKAEGRFIVHGFVGKYKGSHTKIDCECLIDGYKWQPKLYTVSNFESGCPECAGIVKLSEKIATLKCKDICYSMGYTFLSFIGGFKSTKSRLRYKCNTHGTHEVDYGNFVNGGTRCPLCWKERQQDLGFCNGWYPERAEEKDYLYILNFNDEYIKVGRSFDVDDRITKLKSESCCKNINKISIYTALHKEIYTMEQELHEDLRVRGFTFVPDTWYSKETFDKDCLFILNKHLDVYGYTKVF